MSEPLRTDRLENLLAFLRSVADEVHESGTVSQDDLRLLLTGSGLDEDWAVEELDRWVRVLVAVRGTTDRSSHRMAQRAPRLRGTSEASTVLAISTTNANKVEQLAQCCLGTWRATWAPDGTLITASGDGISIIDSDTLGMRRLLGARSDGISSVAVSPDGSTLASEGSKGTVRLWDVATGKELRTLSGCWRPVFSPDGRTLASIREGGVGLWGVR